MSVVVVSWILVLLTVFSMNYTRAAMTEARTVQLEIERHQLRAWAQSGVELAMATLDRTSRIDCAGLANPGPENPLAAVRTCGQGRFTVGTVQADRGRESWRPGLGDEGARLPVAVVDSTTLSMVPGMTTEGASAILAARAAAGEHRLPPFEMLHLDETSLAGARRFLSRYGDAVNVNTAPEEVLRAVGLPRSAVDKILRRRAGPDRVPGTADDRWFSGLETDSEAIRDCALNSEEAAVLAFLHGAGRLTVEPRYFRLASRGWGDGHDGICELRVVLEKPEQDTVRIVEWTENWLN